MVLKTAIFFVISIAAFAVMFTTMAPLTGFLSYHDVPRIVKDNNEETNWFALTESLLWDIFLVLLFIVQHSMMATPTWRGLIYNLGLVVVERSFYIAATAWALQYIMQSWLVIPDYPLWIIDTSQSTPWWWFFTLIHVMAWIIIYGATFTMDLPELLGLKQCLYRDTAWEFALICTICLTARFTNKGIQ
ncbi:unnamed protein product [Owenia fusiformis]|uniref:Nuclear envelope membrane protein n=1 Tax=Owenia fusiformis TaxID=6347 RepID=A0A8J1XVU4_OWEFU|nr:unnamed protein product [Owenia fusiformis]